MSNPANEHSWNNRIETTSELCIMDGTNDRFSPFFEETKENDHLDGYSLQDKLRAQLGLPLTRKENDSIEVLFANLFSAQWPTRVRAIRQIATLWKELPERVRRVLTHALQDESEYVRAIAAESLARFPDHLPIRNLLQIAEDRSWHVRAAVIFTLGHLRQKAPTRLFQRALKDPAPMVRLAALHALKKQETSQFVPDIMKVFDDEDPRVRLTAVEVLQNYLPNPLIYQELLTMLYDQDADVGYETLNILTQRGYHVEADFLLVTLTNHQEAPRLRLKALQILKNSQEYLPLEPFLHVLKDPDDTIREEASKFLAERDRQIPKRVSSTYLLQLLQDEREDFRAFAAWALGEQYAEHAKQALEQAKMDPSPLVQIAAEQALTILQKREVISVPDRSWQKTGQERKTDEWKVKERTTDQWEMRQPEENTHFLASLIDYLQDKYGIVQPQIEQTLSGSVLILFCRFQSNGERWQEVINALARSTRLESVRGALQSPDEIIRSVATQTIKRLKGKKWAELLITSVELLQDIQIVNVNIPTQIVFCGIGLSPTNEEPTIEASVLQEILSTIRQKGINECSQQVGTQWALTKSLSKNNAEIPNPCVLGKVLKNIQAWSGSPQTLVE